MNISFLQSDFITEASEGNGGENPDGGSLAAEGLGLGPNIPRCLRWPIGKMVQMQEMGLQETEREIESIWTVSLSCQHRIVIIPVSY